MTRLHVLRVFVGADGRGGNPLGVFLDGAAIPKKRRQAVAAELGLGEIVFVDDATTGRIAIFTSSTELPFAGHPALGTSWLLAREGRPVEELRPPAGLVQTWRAGDLTWIRARPEWSPTFRIVEYATAADVDRVIPPRLGDPGVYAWAWLDASTGDLRARSFPTHIGILEDEASGSPAVVMGARIGRPITIRQGVGSELHVRPGPGGTVELGGRCEYHETREFAG